jgi:hypothetical protein
MNLQTHKLNLIGTLLDVNDAKLLARIETFLDAEISAARQKEIVPMTMDEYHAEIDRSLEAYHAGRVTSHEDLKKEMREW